MELQTVGARPASPELKRLVMLEDKIYNLVKKCSTDLPKDVENALVEALAKEDANCPANWALNGILENVELSRRNETPLCQDTGTLLFFLDLPDGTAVLSIQEAIKKAVKRATEDGFLRQNTIESVSGQSIASNVSVGAPYININFSNRQDISIKLMLKGGGCENVSTQYSLPDSTLGAGRDLEGVRKCILNAALNAQGMGCSPSIFGVCIGGDRGAGYVCSKKQLLRDVTDVSDNPKLKQLEQETFKEVNKLGIGPMGLSGKTTLLGLKIGESSRLPASYFVTISMMCWACRRATLIVDNV
jgi:fumarate hydratase class I